MQSVHRVPKKTKQICFCQNFVKFPQISIIFGRKMGNDPNICEVDSFSTSPNLRHHLTVLNTNVPNCYITPNVVICNKLLRHWLIAASMIDWSNCVHSLTRCERTDDDNNNNKIPKNTYQICTNCLKFEWSRNVLRPLMN